jgi:hypothetical protein
LVFLFLKRNWKEKLKWVCLLLILAAFSFDIIGNYYSKKPVASGVITDSKVSNGLQTATLQISQGELHEGEFFVSEQFTGSVSTILTVPNSNTRIIELKGNSTRLTPNSNFRVFSTIRLSNLLLLIELSLLFLIFIIIMKDQPFWRNLGIAAIAISAIIWVLRNLVLGKIHENDSIYNGGATLLLIVFSLAFFYYQLSRPDTLFVYASPAFWIVVAVLIYKAGTFFLFLYTNSLSQHEKENFYVINSLLYFLQNLLFAIAFMIPDKTRYPYSKLQISNLK